MNDTENRKSWWTFDHAPTRWAVVVSLVIAWVFAVIFLYPDVMKVLAARPWWEDFAIVLATVAVPILAFLELRHSAEANTLRGEANDQRRTANRLSGENARLAAELDAERNKHLAQIAINTARPAQEPAASLKIHPANRSRYILRQVGQGGAHGDFNGGYFEFSLRVENRGNRNSTVDKYKILIRELNTEFSGIAPVRLNHVQGRHCQHGLAPNNCLNEGSLVRIAPDDSTNAGCLLFFLAELNLEMFANAGLRMQGPERRFGNLHCRLTLIDSNGISASEDFELSED
jgi:hypothetical protein